MSKSESILQKRRSIRKFSSKKIRKTDIMQIIKSGMFAPSAHNREPWYFIVIDDKKIFNIIMENHPYAGMLKSAVAAILVCADTRRQKDKMYYAQDLSATTENMLLQAAELGIGSCWVGIFPKQERAEPLVKALNMPNYIIPFSLVALGYAEEAPSSRHKFEKDRIVFNRIEKNG